MIANIKLIICFSPTLTKTITWFYKICNNHSLSRVLCSPSCPSLPNISSSLSLWFSVSTYSLVFSQPQTVLVSFLNVLVSFLAVFFLFLAYCGLFIACFSLYFGFFLDCFGLFLSWLFWSISCSQTVGQTHCTSC